MKKTFIKLLLALLLFSVAWSCERDEPKPNPEPDPKPKVEPEPLAISKFIWRGLDLCYLWEDKIDALQLKSGSEEWKKYLNKYEKNYDKGLFESLLYRQPDERGYATVDKWSWIVDDYTELEKNFAGIYKSCGFEYRLSRYGNNKGVFGYVTYIIPNSPASKTTLKRGDIFISVNGIDLTVDNRTDLLSKDSYELGLADITETEGKKVIVANGNKIQMDAVELTENPILMTKVFDDINGNKVGYMVYNGFTGTEEFNLALNDSIGKLKTQGVNELVLDLRYNGGGSIYTAILLASLIDGNHTGEVFAKTVYNDFLKENNSNDYFVDKIVNRKDEVLATLNSLKLNRLFVLTSRGTASASELVINGLKPYLDVVLIGTNTRGKYVGSITLYDAPRVWSKKNINPNHKWAMQPIVLKVANSQGVSDYIDGLAVDYSRDEWGYLGDIKPLGDMEEPYLKTALDIIRGETVPVSAVVEKSAHSLFFSELNEEYDSKDSRPFSKEMYRDDVLIKDMFKKE